MEKQTRAKMQKKHHHFLGKAYKQSKNQLKICKIMNENYAIRLKQHLSIKIIKTAMSDLDGINLTWSLVLQILHLFQFQ